MAGATRTSVAMVLIVVTLMSCRIPASHADAAFISHTCKKTKNPALCADVLSIDEDSAKASTVHELAGIALEIATDTSRFIAMNLGVGAKYCRELGTPECDAIVICRRAYYDAIRKLAFSAKHSFDGGDYASASKNVLGAKDAGVVCDNAFKGIKEYSPVEEDRKMTERCAVAAELISLLIHK